MLSSYHAFRFSRPHLKWVTQEESGCYDLIARAEDQCLFAAQSNIAKYFPDQGIPPLLHEDHVGGQRLDIDLESKRLFMPSFMRYSPQEEQFKDVYIFNFDLNLVETLKFPRCVGPLYVQYSKKRERVYYSCEASGQIMEYDIKRNLFHVIARYISPNHIQLDEQETRLFVNPIWGKSLDVYDLDSTTLIRSSPVVPPVYVSITDLQRDFLYVARFVLGDLEIRDLDTLRVLSRIRIDQGPRDMAIDRERGRLFTCNYFTGTLTVVDIEKKTVGRLFAGPRARGVFFDASKNRLYFCSHLGIGYYTNEGLSAPDFAGGNLSTLWHLVKDVFDSKEPLHLKEFFRFFLTLVT